MPKDIISNRPFMNKAKAYSESIKDIVANNKLKTKTEENAAIAAAAILMNLQQLQIEVKKYLELLHELFANLRNHFERSGFHHEILDKENITLADLKVLRMMDDLTPELQAMLDQYTTLQTQVERLNQEIEQAEKELKNCEIQQQQIEDFIQAQEQQQEQIKEQAIDEIHNELSNNPNISELPSKQEIDNFFSQEMTEEEFNEIPEEFYELFTNSARENNPALTPTLAAVTPAIKKGKQEEGEEENQEQNTNVSLKEQAFLIMMNHTPRSGHVIHQLLQHHRNMMNLERAATNLQIFGLVIGTLVRAETLMVSTNAEIESARQRQDQINMYQQYIANQIRLTAGRVAKLEDEMDNLRGVFRNNSVRFTPYGGNF